MPASSKNTVIRHTLTHEKLPDTIVNVCVKLLFDTEVIYVNVLVFFLVF